ncbi:MAG: RsmB/NOP family class I SAM-dependent RNA methyltransferase [Ignisphaera sp.]
MLLYDEALRNALAKVFDGNLDSFLQSLAEPGQRYYVRVNTLRISPSKVVDSLRSRGIEAYLDEELEEAIYIPVRGPHKIELRDKVVIANKYAAESVYMGSHLYAPGVVGCSGNIKHGDVVTVVAENNVVVGEGVATMSCEEILKQRKGLAVEIFESVYKVPPIHDLPEYREGLIYPQSLPAMYVSRVLDPQPKELIVDVCAAPGGKTGHIVELTKGKAFVVAFDHSRKRRESMLSELNRLGHTPFVEVWRTDSRYLHIDFSWVKADKIVVDPPCTALGVRPKLFDRKTYVDVLNAANYQIQFLRSAIKILKKRGVLVYSTCTVTVEENEEVIEKFIEEERCVEPVPIELSRGSKGVKSAKYGYAYLRFHPHEHGTVGYFIARLTKKC